ncbi:MAG: molybdopterin-dependent oxidoreductase [Nitrospirae bacterium]|nr:molybdopterin-dependent oxidoreductase [Nitrospirota bacterium]
MLKRRDFLKIVGLGGIGTGLGFMLGESTKNPAAHLIPYVVPPEDIIPGVADWYSSLCTQCNSGCGIMVRVMEGRAKKIEGNPHHPVNQGRLCVRGQAGLQALYNPDRIQTPLIRKGKRGNEEFQEITWERSLSLLSERLAMMKRANKTERLYLLSSASRGHMNRLFEMFMTHFGSSNYMQYDLFQHKELILANKISMGMNTLPYYDIGNTNLLLSFGADFLNTWISPVNHSLGYGRMRQGRPPVRGRVIQIEPRLSISGANADEWVPVRPGTEGILALGMAYTILETGLYKGGDINGWKNILSPFKPEKISGLANTGSERIRTLAKEFAVTRPSLAIGGENIASYTDGVNHIVAINILNHLADNIEKTGGIIPNTESPIKRLQPVKDIDTFIQDALAGNVDTAIVYNTNPAFTLPADTKVREALDHIPFIVSMSSFMDETTANADLILPTHTCLEDWGDDFTEPAAGLHTATIMQPAVSPLYATNNAGDIFLSIAKMLGNGLQDRMPWNNFRDFLMYSWKGIYEKQGQRSFREPAFEDFWNRVLTEGGWWGQGKPKPLHLRADNVMNHVSSSPSMFHGDEREFPYYLILYAHSGYLDGRHANLPWLQEMPDPMTSVVWGTWVEINPETAGKMGIKEGDIVLVESPYGKLQAPAYLYPGIRPDTISIPIGQGHRTYGRYASRRGANPLDLLPGTFRKETGTIPLNSTRVRITKGNLKGTLVKMEGITKEFDRKIVQTIPPEGNGILSGRRQY